MPHNGPGNKQSQEGKESRSNNAGVTNTKHLVTRTFEPSVDDSGDDDG